MPLLNDADAVYRGTTAVSRVYRGTALVWEPPTTGPVVSDSFDRADSGTSMGTADTGQVWTPLAGTWGIDTNRGYSVGSDPADRQVVVESGVSDPTVAVDVPVLDSGGGTGLLFRGVDANNYWIFTSEGTRWALYKRVTGTHTLVGSFTETPTIGRWEVACSGSSITCKIDSVTKVTATDTTHQTATRHGLRIFRQSATSSSRFDNFTVS